MTNLRLSFPKDRPFKIMQVADAQESKTVAKDTLRLLEASLDEVKPDLVVFTGDQIKGYSPTFLNKETRKEDMKRAITELLGPIIRRNIPFVVTFGNHDEVSQFTREEQMAFYRSFEQCVVPEYVHEAGTYFLPIYKSETSKKIAMGIYLFDTQGSNTKGWEEALHPEVIDWYRQIREDLKGKQGEYVPSVVFQHIPLWEYFDVLKKVDNHTPNAIRCYLKNHAGYYVVDAEKNKTLDFFMETPAVSGENSGQFVALKEKGDIFAVYVGHDHKNCFVSTLDGVDLAYTPCAGFNVYGPGIFRGVREFSFTKDNPRNYKTKVHFFKDLVDTKVEKPKLDFLLQHSPSSVEEGISKGLKAMGALALAGAAIVLAVHYKKRKRR